MIKINLLADREKQERASEEKLGIIMRAGLSVIFGLILLSAMMFSIQTILAIELKSAQEESQTHSAKSIQDIESAENILKDANQISQKVIATSKAVPYWSKILRRLSDDCPDGLKILTIHAEKEHVKISGFAKTREAFLVFQNKLGESGFKNLASPVSNLVSPENLNFTVEFDIDKNYLSQP